jgi:hypothetical protein
MRTKPDPNTYHAVLEACRQPGCPLCRLADQWVGRYLDGLMYENVNDPGLRETLAQSLGFCNEHAWRFAGLSGGASLGVAIIYRSLINQIAGALRQGRYSAPGSLHWQRAREGLDREQPAGATRAVVQSLEPQTGCPACVHRDELETLALTAVVEGLRQDRGLQEALRAAGGLCLPHLRRAFQLVRDEATFETLKAVMLDQLAALLGELDEFIRKNDYRFRHEGFGPEGDSWRRAVAWLVGAEGVR